MFLAASWLKGRKVCSQEHFDHCKIKYRYHAGVNSMYNSCTVPLKCLFAAPFPIYLYTVTFLHVCGLKSWFMNCFAPLRF